MQIRDDETDAIVGMGIDLSTGGEVVTRARAVEAVLGVANG